MRASFLLAGAVVWCAVATVSASATATAAAEPAFWDRVAAPDRDRFDRLVAEARDLLQRAGDAAAAEKTLGAALALDAARGGALADFDAVFLLAQIQSALGRPAPAVEALERAEPLAQLAGQKADCWFRLGVERSKLGRYADALAAYDRELALGSPVGTPYANAAELLMALGRMGEAEERYRDAIRVDEQVGDRRAREPDMALSYYGLGVALDRDEQPVAAREMIGRALALDPNGSKLRLAQQPGSDVFFIPEGEVYYYLGLAAEVDGRADDAEAAFREYIAHPPRTQTQSQSRGRWEPRARAHLDALALSLPRRAPPRAAGAASSTTSPPPPGGVPSRRRWRMLAVATVAAKGPLPAPLIDAAWKHRPPSIEACLAAVEPAAGQDSVRLGFDVEIDARGAVTRVAARLPPPLDAAAAGAGACMESAIKDGLAVARPEHGKATVARIEVLLSAGPATVDD